MVARLGTKNHNFITKCSEDDKISLVSCSQAVPVKRVELILDGLIFMSKSSNNRIIWHFIGSGSELKNLKARYSRIKNSLQNLEVYFHGYLHNSAVFDFYKNSTIDCFISTSASEGGVPVSMQEAQSFGIPVIATNVGGIPEIVIDGETGFLLEPNPTTKQIADTIKKLKKNPDLLHKIKVNSKSIWNAKYNASINFKIFTRDLLKLSQMK